MVFKTYKYYFSILLVLMAHLCKAQSTTIVTRGVITFEEKTNVHKQMAKFGEGGWFEQMKDKIPKYKVVNYNLIFDENESLYKKSQEQPPVDMNTPLWMREDESKNVETYKNLQTQIIDAQKIILDKKFIVEDSFQTYKWKMTDEFRIIAGYNCRRATTIIRDSLYIIAFYTDAIIPSNGPMSFTGLPGTILGLVIPKLNTTLFAKKIDTEIPSTEKIMPPTKGEKISYKKAWETVDKNTNDGWMKKMKNEFLWGLLL